MYVDNYMDNICSLLPYITRTTYIIHVIYGYKMLSIQSTYMILPIYGYYSSTIWV